MKRVISLLAVSALFGSLFAGLGCRGDVFVEPPPSLQGKYKGFYYYRTESNGQVTVEKAQFMSWDFSSRVYKMRWDTLPANSPPPLSAAPNERQFCDVDGTYDLTAGISLEIDDPSVTPVVCIESQDPEGFFALDQSDPDTSIKMDQLIINSVNGDRTIRHIRLFAQ